MNLTIKLIFVLLTLFITSCIAREEGPAERLGRHLDSLSEDITDLTKESEEQRLKREQREQRELDRRRQNRRPYDDYKDNQYEDSSDYYRR